MSGRVNPLPARDATLERMTLLDLVAAVSEVAASDAEVVAAVQGLLRDGRVRVGARRTQPR